MTAEIPIACTLPPGGFTARIGLVEALIADGVLDRAPTEDGLRVRLGATPEIEQRTRALIAAEAECCPFLGFQLTRDGDALLLEITGPAAARPVIDALFDAQEAARRSTTGAA